MRKSLVGAFALLMAATVAVSPVAAKVPPGQAGKDSGPRPPGLIGGGNKKEKETTSLSGCYLAVDGIPFELLVTFPAGSNLGTGYMVEATDGTCGGAIAISGAVANAPDQATADSLCGGPGTATLGSAGGWITPSTLWLCNLG